MNKDKLANSNLAMFTKVMVKLLIPVIILGFVALITAIYTLLLYDKYEKITIIIRIKD